MQNLGLKILFLFMCALAAAVPSWAKTVRIFTVRDGMPSNNISDVAQDANGLIWLATWNGLSLYDGYRFFNFRDDVNGPASSNCIVDIQPDAIGNIWFSTYDNRLGLRDNTNSDFVDLSAIDKRLADFHADKLYATGRHIWIGGVSANVPSVAEITVPADRRGAYSAEILPLSRFVPGSKKLLAVIGGPGGSEWLHTDAGIASADGKVRLATPVVAVALAGKALYAAAQDGIVYRIVPERVTPLKNIPAGRFSDIIAIDGSTLAVSGDMGVVLINLADGSRKSYSVPGAGKIYADSRKRIWIFRTDGSVSVIGSDGILSTPEIDGTSSAPVFYIPLFFEDRAGSLWMAPENGRLLHYDEKKSRLVPPPFETSALRIQSIPDFKNYFVDSNGNLWLVSTNGLGLLNFGYDDSGNSHLREVKEPRSFTVLADGSVLAGSVNGTLDYYDSKGNFKGYIYPASPGRMQLSSTPGMIAPRIYALYQNRDGNVWLGTKGSGIFIIRKDGTYTHYGPCEQGSRYFRGANVYDFHADARGRLWIATYGQGLYLADKVSGEPVFRDISRTAPAYPKDSSSLYLRRITHSDDGTVVLSSNGGIIYFSDSFTRPSDIDFHVSRHVKGDPSSLCNANVMQVLFTREGKVFTNTMGGTVQTVDPASFRTGKLRFSNIVNHDFANNYGNTLSMVEGADGRVYIVRESDIVSYNPSDGRYTVLGNGVFGESHEFTEVLPARGKDGRLYFGSVDGIVRLNPSALISRAFKPEIVFTGVRFEGESERRMTINPENIVLEPGQRGLSLSFAALDYSIDAHKEYAYRLDSDTAWTYIGRNNEIQVANLLPGTHRLYVRSTNGDGTWVDNERYIDIIVKPAFYETWWFRMLIFLLIAAVLFVAVRMYLSSRRNRMLAQLRQREHDFYVNASHRLRTPLSLIGSPVYEVMKNENLSEKSRSHLDLVRRNAKNMLSMVNEMLTKEFNPEDLTSGEAATRSADSADRAPKKNTVAPTGVQAKFISPDAWLDVPESEDESPGRDIRILIVEDNEDLLQFLNDILSRDYTVSLARNGREGLDKAKTEQPDFILTDITMPEMDGLTMVRNIKKHKELSHIPIIVLSAKASMSDHLEGLRAGIDDYISKPFSATYLRQRIANVISQRRVLQQAYFETLGKGLNSPSLDAARKDNNAHPEPGSVSPKPEPGQEYRLETPRIIEADRVMMDNLMKFLEKKISDENLRIEDMAEAVNMGRTVFYGKIRSIVGMSPSDFLRKLRMQRAEDLIARSRMNFSQIAFSVGFSDPKYFTKCFKKETGMTPSEYRQKNRSGNPPSPDSTNT